MEMVKRLGGFLGAISTFVSFFMETEVTSVRHIYWAVGILLMWGYLYSYKN